VSVDGWYDLRAAMVVASDVRPFSFDVAEVDEKSGRHRVPTA